MIELISELIKSINGVVWGPIMLFFISATGIYLTVGLKLYPIRNLARGFKLLWQGRESNESGEISPFNALMTSLSATIGTGNIAGVATAIFMGGPGALFWMWMIALVGMATKYAEAVCAVHFRAVDSNGNHIGGPMYYIKNGLSKHFAWLGFAFAIFGMIAGFGIGNTVQSNSVADALYTTFELDKTITGGILFVLVGAVLLGGIQRIAKIAGFLVPIMAISYLFAGIIILIINIEKIPVALDLILESAFTPIAEVGGFAGATVWLAIRYGVARGVFSNEAGLGSAPIAHASAKTNNAVKQGTIAMLGTFIDTILICSMTGLVIIISGAWTSGESGSPLSTMAFAQSFPTVGGIEIGKYIVSISLSVFAFTTILGWSVYGERCTQFLFGDRAIIPFRILWTLAVPIGTLMSLDFVWLLADTLNALMAIPNLIALVLLSPVVFRLTSEYLSKNKTTG